LTSECLEKFSVSRTAKRDGLRLLEAEGLIKVTRRDGKNPLVTILGVDDEGQDLPADGIHFISGPLPLVWWSRVLTLKGGKVLAVAFALWLQRGLTRRAANLQLPSSILGLFSLNRSAVDRAYKKLERAGLIMVSRNGRKKRRVTLLGVDDKGRDIPGHIFSPAPAHGVSPSGESQPKGGEDCRAC
jgi:DNA-binding transcriptional ArsR family regulator